MNHNIDAEITRYRDGDFAQYLAQGVLDLKPGVKAGHLHSFRASALITPELVAEIDLLMLDPDTNLLALTRLEGLRRYATQQLAA